MKIKVGVLRGGPSSEHEISLLTGANVLKNLPSDKYEAIDILIGKDGKWPNFPAVDPVRSLVDTKLGNGLLGFLRNWNPIQYSEKEKISKKFFLSKTSNGVDVVFNALHGEYGEDGQVQAVLEKKHLPYTGSGVTASALAMDKWASQKLFHQAGLKVAPAIQLQASSVKLQASSVKFDLPWVIKPNSRGSSVGVYFVNNEKEFQPALNGAFQYDDLVLVEKFIKGKEVTCGILENFNGEKYFALPVVEIVPPDNKTFFDYQCKYNGTTQEICPGRFDEKITLAIQSAAVLAHQTLGCRDYSRTDMIVAEAPLSGAEDGIYVLEVNTLPGLTKESLFPKAAAVAGCSFDQLLEHLLTLALKRKS